MNIQSKIITTIGMKTVLNYLEKSPETNVPKLMSFFDSILPENLYSTQRASLRKVINDPDGNWYKLLMSLWNDIDPEIRKTFFTNFIINANLEWDTTREEAIEKYGCNIPWAILLDPTSACNMHCTGCWAAEYGPRLNLSFDEIDSIIMQGKELGVHMYIYTGGEPLMRKSDLIAICNKHSDCEFLFFTNGTMIDEAFADEMLRVKNFIPAISIEGFREATDMRRGPGAYDKVIRAMTILKQKKIPFGVSCCYTSQNLDSISSEEFIDHIISLGAKFAWFFHYMPVGMNAMTSLMPNPEQRELMVKRIAEYRKTKPLFTIDFQNDGRFVGGCIAGGRNYLHINPNGDIEPCVFIHYSDSNIREKTLLEALQSPLFMAYKKGQPFNENHFRPCPMLENPAKLIQIVNETGASSTDLEAPESACHLCGKCMEYADNWKPTADKLWADVKKS